MCAQADAWREEIAQARAQANLGDNPLARAAEVTDARIRGQRAHTLAAERFERSWRHLRSAYPGAAEGDCPKVKDKDEFVYVFGMVTGMMALLHDRAGGGHLKIGLDRPLQVARATRCMGDTEWWSLPLALRAGAWATVPGSAPEGTDPWDALQQAAETGATTGIRAAAAIRVLIAANAGRTDLVEQGIRAFPDAAPEGGGDKDWQLLDAYAVQVVLHQSDLLWTRSAGHRTETLGVLPSDAAPTLPDGPDPFGSVDPFGPPPDPSPDTDPSSDPEDRQETP